MYTQFYGFSERPFSLLPDPDYLFFSHQHQTALALLETAVINNSGFCMLSGEIGAGKTTLLRELLNRLDDDVTIGLVNNTHASFGNLMQWILGAFGLVPVSENNVDQYQQFVDFVIAEYAKNRHTLLIIDEAQQLTPESMEELRMLSNINSDKDFVLQVIIAGQNELRVKMQSPELTQFAQRISIDYHLEYLDLVDTSHYIRHRLQHAGGAPDLFDMSACRTVFENTGGVPRLINRLCDICLVYGYAAESKVINSAIVTSVVEDKQAGEFVDVTGNIDVDESLELTGAQIEEPVKDHLPNKSSELEHTISDKEIVQGDLEIDFDRVTSSVSSSVSGKEPTDDDTIYSSIDTADATEPGLFQDADYKTKEAGFGAPQKNDDLAFDVDGEMASRQSALEIPDLYSSGNRNKRAIIPMLLIALFTVISILAILDISGHEPEFVAEYKDKLKAFSFNQNKESKQASTAIIAEPDDIQEALVSSDPIIEERINTSPMIVNREKIDTTKTLADSVTNDKTITDNETDIKIQTNYQLSQDKAQLLRKNIQQAVDGMAGKPETVVLDAEIEKEEDLATIDEAPTTNIDNASNIDAPTKAPVAAERPVLQKSDIAAAELVEITQSESIKPDQKSTPSITNDSVAARRAAAQAAMKRDRKLP